MTATRLPHAALLLAAALGLGACAPTVIGAGATAGVAAAEERGIEGAIDDVKIRAEINHYWFQHDIEMYRQVALTISEGRVLLTGIVPRPEARVDAVRLAWQAAGVKEVINEVQVGDSSVIESGRDVVISQKLKGRLMFDKEIRNINYTVEVVDGVVYLMGIAQNDGELERVIAHARDISGVKRVVNHVRLRNDPRRVSG
ncbi:MAG: BON domain-containing protein [Magnetospirillum sp.]|nr:BON domain-containing protein [Magnetospirillum sp.]